MARELATLSPLGPISGVTLSIVGANGASESMTTFKPWEEALVFPERSVETAETT